MRGDPLAGEPTYEHVTLAEAWQELSHVAFGVWVRMQNLGKVNLKSGHSAIGKALGFGRTRFTILVQELERKGYIDVITHAKFTKSEIILKRHAIIDGKNTFVKLGPVLEMKYEEYLAKKERERNS